LGIPVNYYKSAPKNKKKKIDLFVSPITIDDELEKFLLFGKKERNSKLIPLFGLICEEEIVIASRLLGMPFKRKASPYKNFLDKIEKKHTGSKFGFIKSVKFL
jgi:hypothetical protein